MIFERKELWAVRRS